MIIIIIIMFHFYLPNIIFKKNIFVMISPLNRANKMKNGRNNTTVGN